MGLKNKSNRDRFEPNSSAYLLSKTWLTAYKKYILFADVKRNNKPETPAVDQHPGPITNVDDLCDLDLDDINLKGTGKVEQFPSDIVDRYVKENARERYQYKVINQELWDFLFTRYGGEVIRRIAIPLSQWSTTVEVRLKQLPLVVLPCSRLFEGGDLLAGLETEYKVQLGKRCKYGDLKKRIVDCINANKEKLKLTDSGVPITEADIRLWKFSDQKE